MRTRFAAGARASATPHRVQRLAGCPTDGGELFGLGEDGCGGQSVFDFLFVSVERDAQGFFHVVFHRW